MIVGGAAMPQSLIEAFEKRHGLHDRPRLGHDRDWRRSARSSHAPARSGGRADDGSVRAPRETGPPGAVCRDPRAQRRRARRRGTARRWASSRCAGRGSAAAYYNRDDCGDRFTDDGWFRTGDIVTIDDRGDRQHSGSVERPDQVGRRVDQLGRARVRADGPSRRRRGRRHSRGVARNGASGRWPPSCSKPGAAATADDLRAFLAPQFPRFWLPDAFEFIDAIPRTSAGKFQKAALRARFKDYRRASRLARNCTGLTRTVL